MDTDMMNSVANGAQLLELYGPYAVLALFALLIAPYLTKQCYRIQEEGFNKKLSGGIACGSWLVVVSMVIYITFNWTPTKVYSAGIGKFDQGMKVTPVQPDGNSNVKIYVKTKTDTIHSKQNRWGYALIVGRGGIENKNECATFSISWEDKNKEAVDLDVPLSDLIESRHLKFKFLNHISEGDAFIYHDGKWTSKGICGQEVRAEHGFFKTAYADHNPLHKISQGLQSSNSVTRAQARKKMRRLNKNELSQLRGMIPPGSSAQKVVNKELARR